MLLTKLILNVNQDGEDGDVVVDDDDGDVIIKNVYDLD